MNLNFEQCSEQLLQALHNRIAQLLAEEDSSTPGHDKRYGIREFPDWRQCADEFERIMEKREISYTPINWV